MSRDLDAAGAPPPPPGSGDVPPARAWGMIGWGLALGVLFVLWQRPALVTDLVRPTEHLAACDLAAAPCAVALPGGGTLTLATHPRVGDAGAGSLPAGVPLAWRVEADGAEVSPEALEITGRNMNMGLTRLPLSPEGPAWEAHGALPLCSHDHMDWRIDLRYRTAGGTEGLATFLATSHRPPDDADGTAAAR